MAATSSVFSTPSRTSAAPAPSAIRSFAVLQIAAARVHRSRTSASRLGGSFLSAARTGSSATWRCRGSIASAPTSPIAAAAIAVVTSGGQCPVCRAWPIRSAHHIATSAMTAPNSAPISPRSPRGPPTAIASDTTAATSASIGQLGARTNSGTSAAPAAIIRQPGLPCAIAAPAAMPRIPPAMAARPVTG
ncbi:MAG: hypothetical protein E6J91_32685 [Deltaproteobacteria bacterium]|nr:MAG: hypothetical protein E6J91_32685 [Deltaproteobacteria bacterium]